MNTPLAVLQGSIEKLLETKCDDHTRERLQRMLRVTQRLRSISEGLVDFAQASRRGDGTRRAAASDRRGVEPGDIDEKASQVKFSNGMPEGLRPLSAMADGSCRCSSTCCELAPVGSARRPDRRALRKIDREGKRWIGIAVEDDGTRHSGEVLPSIFPDAFVSSRLDSQGTGLGLTVAAGIVHQHEGQIPMPPRPAPPAGAPRASEVH